MAFIRAASAFAVISWLCLSARADDIAEAVKGFRNGLQEVRWAVTFEKDKGTWRITDESILAEARDFETDAGGLTGRLAQLPALRSLYISQDDLRLSPVGCERVSTLTQLRRLGFGSGYLVDSRELEGISGLPELQALSINCKVSDEDLVSLKNFPKLRRLIVTDLSDAAWKHIKALSELEELSLEGNHTTTAKQLAKLKGLGNLRSLSTWWVDTKGALALKDLPHLEELRCRTSRETADFSALRGLKTLDVGFERNVRKLLLPENLQQLTVSAEREFDLSAKPLPKYVMHFEVHTYLDAAKKKALREWLASIPQLVELTQWEVRDDDLKGMAALKSLRRLSIGAMCVGAVSDEGMKAIGELEQLEALNLRICIYDVSADVWRDSLRKLQGLKELSLMALFDKEPERLAAIGELKGLRSLTLEYDDLDAKLPYLENLGELEELILRGKVTDEGLKHLTGLKKLRRLDLACDSFSDDALISLMRALPKLRVVKLGTFDVPRTMFPEKSTVAPIQ